MDFNFDLLSEHIDNYRESKLGHRKITLKEFAELCDIREGTLYYSLNNTPRFPALTLYKLTKVLKTKMEDYIIDEVSTTGLGNGITT